jgi:hypothetical protein
MADYKVYVSDLPNSGEFNVILVATFANTSDLAPNKARYDAFMRAWGTQNEAASRTTTTTVYPNIRDITGEYLMREVTFLPAKKSSILGQRRCLCPNPGNTRLQC